MSECPACGAPVDVEWVFSERQCHECDAPLRALIERAQTEVAR
jgi:predicted nucleic acid-binding Zn ribbon protein